MGSEDDVLEDRRFRLCVIDEATQVCWNYMYTHLDNIRVWLLLGFFPSRSIALQLSLIFDIECESEECQGFCRPKIAVVTNFRVCASIGSHCLLLSHSNGIITSRNDIGMITFQRNVHIHRLQNHLV